MSNLRNEWYKRELSESESEIYHRPMEEEYSFYTAVKNGDMEFVLSLIHISEPTRL